MAENKAAMKQARLDYKASLKTSKASMKAAKKDAMLKQAKPPEPGSPIRRSVARRWARAALYDQ